MVRFRIAMVAACPFPFQRGTPARIFRMAEALSERGHSVHVVTYHLGQAHPETSFRIHRIPYIPTYAKTSPGPSYQKLLVLDPLLAFAVARLLRKEAIDVLHAHHYEGLIAAAMGSIGCRRPIVFDAHTTLSELQYYDIGLSTRTKRWVGTQLDSYLPRLASHIVAVTDEIRDKFIRINGAVPPITVVPNGIEADHFDAGARIVSPGTRPPGADDENTILYTGNLAGYQGIGLLLESFRYVLDKKRGVRLLIASDNPFDTYEGLARKLAVRQQIDLVPLSYEDLPGILARGAVAVNPRVDCDGIPLKLLNYMAAGKPIVSFAGSARHLVNGENGLIVANNDTRAFATAVLRLLDDRTLARRLGDNAGRHIRATLSWERVATDMEAIYENLTATPSAAVRSAQPATMPKQVDERHTRPAEVGSGSISVVMVNYNGGDRILNALRALTAQSASIETIIVVDNGSTDGSPNRIATSFPQVEILALGENRGLPAARNAGLRRAETELVLFVDSDVYVTNDCILRLEQARRESDATVVCPRILLFPDLETIQCDGASVHFVGTMGLRHGYLPLARNEAGARAEVGACIGACFLAHRSRVLAAGGFDEAYFFYFEDLEFSLRLRLLGHRLICEPSAIVYHDRGAGTDGLSFRGVGRYPPHRAYLTLHSRLLTMLTYYRKRTLLALAPALVLYELATLAMVLRRGWGAEWVRAWLWQFRHAGLLVQRRRRIARMRVTTDKDLLVGGALPLAPGFIRSRPAAAAVSLLSGVLNAYWRVVRWCIT